MNLRGCFQMYFQSRSDGSICWSNGRQLDERGFQGGNMATGPCEELEWSKECLDSLKEPPVQKEGLQKPLKEDSKEDVTIPAPKEINSTPNGTEKGDANKLHLVGENVDEFVDSVSDAAPSMVPEQEPAKLPRAEQVAEKVLRAEKVVERTPRAEKSPGMEKAVEKVTRVEKASRVEKTVRAEKPAEKVRLAAPAAAKSVTAKRKVEVRPAGPAKDTLPWEGLTLNKCLLVASFVALLSVSCQVAQDIIEYGGEVLEAELNAWTSQESSVGEVEELWFYERWFNWSDSDEPPDAEEEEEPIEMGEEEMEEEEEEMEEEEEEMEEEEEEAGAEVKPRKSQDKVRRRERLSKDKGHKASEQEEEEEEEEDEEEEPAPSKRPPRKGKEQRRLQEETRGRQPRHEAKEPKREHRPQEDPKDERGRGKGQPHAKPQRDHKAHPHEQRGRKPWRLQPPKESGHKFGKQHD
ncbi:junctional sarcoplasmic reticulum protein 1 isoform X2 [Rhineura floridana]|uniref:junctional sarcoplasmic reticulum protein 1 isoform X2 n=1 Tax=Rhineura floridana TaxID=261503 RepID=UPI002AC845BB|nr:junctional sarcoplasmic reticulum protein 1 isoform X2 [Rhineura floridana]